MNIVLPAAAVGWSGPVDRNDDWLPEYHGAIVKKQAYTRDGRDILLYVGYYPAQKQGEELISYSNRINNPEVWQTKYTRAKGRVLDDMQVLEQKLESGRGRQRLVWYWYSVGGILTTKTYVAKALQVLGALTGNTRSYVIAVAVDDVEGAEEARDLMHEFISDMENIQEKLSVQAGR